jgi:hypothetical protein
MGKKENGQAVRDLLLHTGYLLFAVVTPIDIY